MRTLAVLGFSFSLALGGCGVDSDDPSTASTDQAITNITDCATGAQENADGVLALGADGTYTRNASTIDPTGAHDCGCKAWQADDNANGEAQADHDFPSCRPGTIVQYDNEATQQTGYLVNALVPSWTLTNGQTECENSTLDVRVDFWNGTKWQDVWPGVNGQGQDLAEQVHGKWQGGTCQPAGLTSPQGVVLNRGTYRVHATATRGLAADNHGFETVQIWANVY
ncbi:MAG TPA: hypothetical protein VLX92_34350 [Kofleriaceae bacterium]|nr:hypothetical protein [Kofleriaceae bacterium]